MAAALRINASSEPRSSPHEQKRKSTEAHGGNNDKRNPSVISDKYIHVHHYVDTGRWGTWFNDPTLQRGSGKRRLYFGTYETEYLAARAQDRAALKFKPDAVRQITQLNFAEADYVLDSELRKKLTHEQFRRLLMAESRKCYKRAQPSPCWRIFLEEEAANGNIHIEDGNRPNRYQRQPRTFNEVLQDIVNKAETVNIVEITEPIHEPVSTGEEEVMVYTAKRTRRPIQAAPNQPATKEPIAEGSVDPAALRTKNLTARQVREVPPVAVQLPRRNAKSASLSARRVGKSTPKAAPRVPRRDARSGSLSARSVKATPKAAPPAVRCDTRSAGLSAQHVRQATPKAASPVLRCDARSARQSARQVPEGASAAAPPVRLEPSIPRRGVWREGHNALQTSQQCSVYLDRLYWGRTRGRSVRSLPNATSADEATVAADSLNNIRIATNMLSEGTNGTSDNSAQEKVAISSDRTTVENPSKRGRLNIDLNLEPEPSSTAGAVAPPHGSNGTCGNDDEEVSSAESLLLLKSGWLQ